MAGFLEWILMESGKGELSTAGLLQLAELAA
jgi:hypothetical protein